METGKSSQNKKSEQFTIAVTKKTNEILLKLKFLQFKTTRTLWDKADVIAFLVDKYLNDQTFANKVNECLKTNTEKLNDRVAILVSYELRLKLVDISMGLHIPAHRIIGCMSAVYLNETTEVDKQP